jgi:succinoglycan biosynthesis protein ExoM
MAAPDGPSAPAPAPLDSGVRLTVAVLTFRRPQDLDAVLPLLVEQADAVGALGVTARVVVVDNDPARSACERVERGAAEALAATGGRVRVHYEHESVPGIAAARNRALDAGGSDQLLVFIDDDERPSERWLVELVALQRSTGAAAVVGPVRSEYAVQPEPFIVAGGFFERRRLATGTPVDVAATNNLLLDLGAVRRWGLRFDLALGQLGGEDTLFTRSVVAHGGRMVWCAEAMVTDVVPEARVTRRWVLQRAYSSGNGWGLTSVMLAGRGPRRCAVRLRVTAQGVTRLAGGASRWAAGVVTGSLGRRARGLRTVLRGAGMVAGAWGSGYREYTRD